MMGRSLLTIRPPGVPALVRPLLLRMFHVTRPCAGTVNVSLGPCAPGAADRAARASVTRTCASARPGFATARYSWTEVPPAPTAKENVVPRRAVPGVLLAARRTPRAPTRRMRRVAVMRAAEDTTAAAILSGPMSVL